MKQYFCLNHIEIVWILGLTLASNENVRIVSLVSCDARCRSIWENRKILRPLQPIKYLNQPTKKELIFVKAQVVPFLYLILNLYLLASVKQNVDVNVESLISNKVILDTAPDLQFISNSRRKINYAIYASFLI